MFLRFWRKHFTVLGFTIVLAFISTTTSEETKIISLPNGKVKGMAMRTVYGREYFGFQGIPYGKPPVGKLRFQAPVKADPWDGVLDATKSMTYCRQPAKFFHNIPQSEDCLTLNVYTPQINYTFQELYAVILYIHGGNNIYGPTVWEGQYRLLDRNVLFVLPLYRLGLLGYATTLDENLPGNYGQLDQLLAAQWVQDNIVYFGGDAKRVTIMGHSTGAADVTLHAVSPLSKGLFRNVIAMSMCPLTKTLACKTGKPSTIQGAKRLKCPTNDSKSILECFMNVSHSNFSLGPMSDLLPLPAHMDNTSGYMPNNPLKQIFQPTVQKIPMMIGILPNDGATTIIYLLSIQKNLPTNISFFGKIIPLLFPTFGYMKDLDAILQLIKKEYNIANESEMTEHDATELSMNVSTEFLFKYGCDCNIALLTKAGFQIFAYYLNHEYYFPHQRMSGRFLEHATDLPFIMKVKDYEYNYTGEDYRVSEEMIDLWTNFAIYGEPTPREFIEKKGKHPYWEPWTFSHPKHLIINAHPTIENGNYSKNPQFWKKFAAQYQEV